MKAAALEEDYLGLVYRLLPSEAAGLEAAGVGAVDDLDAAALPPIATPPQSVPAGGEGEVGGRGKGGDREDTADEERITLVVTLVWHPGALSAPLRAAPAPAVVRAYGAYGLPADLAFAPDDLPLLDRCAHQGFCGLLVCAVMPRRMQRGCAGTAEAPARTTKALCT